jgi:hypothetical protein
VGKEINQNALPHEYHTSMVSVLEKPGYYAWLLFNDGSFAAARTFSSAEILSKHGDLYMLFPKPVVAAGECLIDDKKNVLYNYESGTFMGNIHSQFAQKYKNSIVSYKQFYDRFISKLWMEAGATSVKLDTRFQGLIRHGVKMNAANISKYRNAGFTVRKFKSRANCDTLDTFLRTYRKESANMPYPPPFDEWMATQSKKVHYEPYFSDGGSKKSKTRKGMRMKKRATRKMM